VISVSEENNITQHVLSAFKECIQNDQININEYSTTLQSLSLMDIINTRHFSGSETPKYLQSLHIPTEQIESVRFSLP
jgi:hypothetical protein